MQRLMHLGGELSLGVLANNPLGAGYQTQVNTCYLRDTLPYQRDELERAFVFHVKRW